MDILKMLPKQAYTLDGVTYVVTNTSANVNISDETRNNKILFLDYQILDGETPRKLAQKAYDNSAYYWVTPLINGMTNTVNDWPKTVNELYDSAMRDWGEEKLYEVLGYSDPSGNVVDLPGLRHQGGYLDDAISDNDLIVLNELTPFSRFDIIEMENDKKRQIKLLDPDYIDLFVNAVKRAFE
ncbi:MAG: hypothetical protein ACRCTP_04340 [Aeromonas popoffii]|uniref:hypothetical protein n=1 Tax=Aeromonas popoffii TaxID=70856 RepID=UPI003F3EE667